MAILNDHGYAHGSPDHGNALVEEMVKLDVVFREVVSGVALGDGARVHQALEQMHGAMEKTHEAVHHGTVKLHRNADRMQEFMAQDKLFHEKLETLAGAAQKNDRERMLQLTQELLAGCVKCHGTFK